MPTAKKLMYVQWKDHWTRSTGWVSDEEVTLNPDLYGMELANSVGWLFKETEDALYLTATISEDEHRLEMCILKSCITKQQELKVKI